MPGFLNRAAKEEDAQAEDDTLEEQYMKMFPKIGRDFVHREDLANIMRAVMTLLDPLGLSPIDLLADEEARKRAVEYRAFLDQDKLGSDTYKDLIKLDEEEDE